MTGTSRASPWLIEDEEGTLPCTVVGPEPGREETRAIWSCERASVGHIRVDFGGFLATIHGEPLRDLDGHALARVEVGETMLAEPDGVTLLR